MTDISLEQAQKLRERIANWSDKNLHDARAFVESQKELIFSRDLSNAQLHGFLNVVRNVTDAGDIKKFIQNQAIKAERAGKFKEKMYEFWKALQDRSEIIRAEAAAIAREVDHRWANQPERETRIYQQLLQKYTQHVIAEKLLSEKQIIRGELT
ncbi:hypothetical protein HUU05_28100 [candidate division KSB1 bacterium]|nr:hypothetical protein [candidate division KSB1 bacterium]